MIMYDLTYIYPRLADVVKCVSKLYSAILVWETDLLYAKGHLFGPLHIYPDLSFLENPSRVPSYQSTITGMITLDLYHLGSRLATPMYWFLMAPY